MALHYPHGGGLAAGQPLQALDNPVRTDQADKIEVAEVFLGTAARTVIHLSR